MARYAAWTKVISILLIVIALVVIARSLPIDRLVQGLQQWIEGLGVWGPLVFGLIYVLATVLLAPVWVLTVAAGALFGLWIGVVTASLASTTGAACALLIARYLARDKVARMARRYPRFGAIDRAISKGGWKIVVMLRLSPAVPFNLQNYLYGLTSIRFWTCVLASWAAMLPGTFMYVYFGYLGRVGVGAAAGGGSVSVWQWVLWIIGGAATVAVTVYITRLARRAIRRQTHIADEGTAGGAEAGSQAVEPEDEVVRRPLRSAVIAALAAVLMLIVAGLAWAYQDSLRDLLGPPAVTMTERYEPKPGGPSFDHSGYDALLRRYVADGGWVDYRALAGQREELDGYIRSIAGAEFDAMGRDEKLALLVNAYNAFTLKLIVEHYPVGSILDIPTDRRWDDVRWRVGSHTWSLNQIEHEQIRPNFREPRVHFALVCAAVGCPPLRNEAYTAEHLEQQLEEQARYVHGHERWFRYDRPAHTVHLTSLYDWYGGDFAQVAGSVLEYVGRYAPSVAEALEAGRPPDIVWLDYDWSLNSVENAP